MLPLLKNETTISKEKIKKVNQYASAKKIKMLDLIKISVCAFIISYSILLILKNNFEGAIYILFAIWGIKDTVVKKIRKEKLIYEFYEDYFELKTSDRILYIDYKSIKKIVKEDKTYYIILNKCGLFIDKDNFTIGSGENMLTFLNERFNIEINKKY